MDYTKTGVIKETQDMRDFGSLKTDLFDSKLDRTVENWNICREQFKTQYNEKVIWMLDASGFISKWLLV